MVTLITISVNASWAVARQGGWGRWVGGLLLPALTQLHSAQHSKLIK